MKFTKFKIALSGTAVVVIALAIAALVLVRSMYGNCIRGASVDLYLPKDATYSQVMQQLRPHLKHRTAFRLYGRHIGLGKQFHRGYYRLRRGMSVKEVARMFERGRVQLTLNNVRTLDQLAARIALQIDADSTEVLAALRNPALREEVGFDRDSLMAMFLPDTYEVYSAITPEDLMRRLRREYDRFWTPAREQGLQRTGLTRYQTMTLASIVYEETKAEEEMPLIAAIYLNRLHDGMRLQACPTVKFAMGRFDLKRILSEYLRYPSPYNTYTNRGLPPGPICMPSVAAIDAVLEGRQTAYLYFCARPQMDGRHNFARNLEEHHRNSRAYSAALDSLNIK